MICVLTKVKVADNCGARVAQCIKLLGGSLPKRAIPGKTIVVVIKRADPDKRKVRVGSVARALVVRTTIIFFRGCGLWVRFGHNAVIITNKKAAPYGKRLRGPFLKEICINYNLLGTVTRFIV
jgi:large subunit ribosomal protein L14